MTDIAEIAIAVVISNAHVLIGQRQADQSLAGYWEFPGGKIESSETSASAAARECFEETGIRIHVGPLWERVEQSYSHGTVRLHFHRCHPTDPTKKPHAPFRWVARNRLADFKFPAANADVVRQLVSRRTDRM